MSDEFERMMKNMDNMLINGIDENFYNNIRNTILRAKTNIYKNINYEMDEKFYTMFQNCQTLSNDLSWSHYIQLSEIKDKTNEIIAERKSSSHNMTTAL